ncbi:MAG: sugar phosphate isomerase [Spirochaetaceae bacterium]
MSSTAEYNHYATDEQLQARAQERAQRFVQEEQQFHLGFLPTEQSHPLTRSFAQTMQRNASEGIRQLLLVDCELSSVARRAVLTAEMDALVGALSRLTTAEPQHGGRLPRVCFSGCGSTGRLAITLEEMWRYAFEAASVAGSGVDPTVRSNQACSIITGGDRALIRSVENFEDYRAFGARQVADLDLGPSDVLVAISEGGETSSVIGTVDEALRRGCTVFFAFNNPRELLIERVERSRSVIEDPRVVDIDLFTGPMALSGSTRMQATTIEMLVLGIALEEALSTTGRPAEARTGTGPLRRQSRLDRVDAFARLVFSLQQDTNRGTMARWAADEAAIYRHGGLVTYFAGDFLLDIFSDTTERSPTFMLPPFRPSDDATSPLSWSFAKDPRYDTQEAWLRMLRREPRGINWTEEDYRAMDAPAEIAAQPPTLDVEEIYRYGIGREADSSRWSAAKSLALWIDVDGSLAGPEVSGNEAYSHRRVLAITTSAPPAATTRGVDYEVAPEIAPSPIRLFHHLAMKLIFNTVSTGSMGILGRIRRNWMIQVDPTNKKLIDRGTRIISQLAGVSYEDACYELHVSLEAQRRAEQAGEGTTTSPVVAALERIDRAATEP